MVKEAKLFYLNCNIITTLILTWTRSNSNQCKFDMKAKRGKRKSEPIPMNSANQLDVEDYHYVQAAVVWFTPFLMADVIISVVPNMNRLFDIQKLFPTMGGWSSLPVVFLACLACCVIGRCDKILECCHRLLT